MSCDLSLGGVKRKVSFEAKPDSMKSEENEQKRQKLDSFLPISCSAQIEDNLVVNDIDKTSDPSSPNSLSSRSISDDNNEDSDDEEGEFLEGNSFHDNLGDGSRGLAESESGYDERASNSSLSSSSSNSSDFDYLSPNVSTSEAFVTNTASNNGPMFLRDLSSSSTSSPSSSYMSSGTSLISNSNHNGLNEFQNGSCTFMSPVNARRSTTSSYTVHSRSYTNTSKDSINYQRKRQQIFNMSLYKMSRFRQANETSLLRSVLICNTLRMLEKDFEKEGVKINFGPNGVSFISPVPPSSDLDFVPAFQSSSQSSYECTSDPPEPTPFGGTLSSTENEPYSYTSLCESNCDTSEYDKYFSMDSGSSSGRVTPFLKNFSSGDYPQNRTGELNSAFWTSEDEQVPDRLSSLNWSSMLSFSNSSSSSSSNEISLDQRHQNQSRSEVLSPGAMISYQDSDQSLPARTSSSVLTSSCDSNSSSSVTFATLLPRASIPSSSSPSIQPNPLQVSPSASSDSYLLSSTSSVSSTYFSISSSLPLYSQSPTITQQTCGTSSVISSNSTSFSTSAPSLMSSTYMNSYLSYSTNSDEIFGDIDLSLYDFDIFSPLSPPYAANKSAPIMSAEELIRNINSSDCNGSPCSSSTPSLLSISHYSVNGFSGQSYTSSNYCMSSSSMTNVVSSITTSSSAINSQMMMSQTVSIPSSASVNCGSSSSSAGTGLHLHTASGRYYKTPEERDQQTLATIKCHN